MKGGYSCSFDKFPLCCSISELSRFQLCSKQITPSQWNAVPRSIKETDSMSLVSLWLQYESIHEWFLVCSQNTLLSVSCSVEHNLPTCPYSVWRCVCECARVYQYHRVLIILILWFFFFKVALRSLRPYGLLQVLGMGSPGQPPRPAALKCSQGTGVWCIMPPCGVNMHVLAWKWNWKFMRIVNLFSVIHNHTPVM